jgi:hypothetical protein
VTDEGAGRQRSKHVERVTASGRALQAAVRASDSYALLLVLLLVDYFLLAALEASRLTTLIRAPVLALTLLLALRTSHAKPVFVRFAQVGAGLAVGGALVYAVTGERLVIGGVNLVIGLVLVSTPVFILQRILGHERVGTETILGALCVYVLIGLTFASVFIAIEIFGDHHFAVPASANNGPDLLYLSFITLTTVGFGDVVASDDLGRALLVLEAIIGQIFLITLVARLVAMFGEEGPRKA